MNLFYVLPNFLVGLAFGFLVLRTNSVLPAVLAHLAFSGLQFGVLLVPGLERILPAALAQADSMATDISFVDTFRIVIALAGALAAASILALVWLLSRPLPRPAITTPRRPDTSPTLRRTCARSTAPSPLG